MNKVLFKRRDELRRIVGVLQGQKELLSNEVADLSKEKEKLETIIKANKIELQGVLVQALMNLKQQRPNLFILTGQDQMVSIVRLFLGLITK